MGIYRVYLRGHNQTVSEKTVTESPTVAEAAFREMMKRRDLWCTPNAAVLSLDNHQLEFRRFDYIVPADPHYAELVKHKKHIPDYPRYLYPDERELIDLHSETHNDDKFVVCYFQKTYRGCPFIDDSRVRLFHSDPEF